MRKDIRMIDIANQLNISVVTVSNALNDREGVSIELRELIKKTADKIGYKYNVNDKAKPKIENRNIGILISDRFIGDKGTFYWRLYHEVSKELLKNNLFAINETLSMRAEKEYIIPKILTEKKVSGLIVLGQLKHDYLEVLLKTDVPVLFLDFYDKHYSIDSVVTDNFYGMYILTDYLIENGHKKIGFVGNIKATSSIHDRFLGYMKALMENDIAVDNKLFVDDRDDFGLALKELVFPKDLPTAFVCNCDETAFRVINNLKMKGIKVPEEISVVGFDNYIVSDVCDPTITTIEVNLKAMAETAVDIMIKKLENPKYRAGRKIILGKLIIKNSVCDISEK